MPCMLFSYDNYLLVLEHLYTRTNLGDFCIGILESRSVEGGRGVVCASHGDEFDSAGI